MKKPTIFTSSSIVLVLLFNALAPSIHAQGQATQLPPEADANEPAVPGEAEVVGDPATIAAPVPNWREELWGRKVLTGDLGGARPWLDDKGFTFKITLMNQVMANMYGGKETKNGHDFAGSYELDFYFDMEEILDIEGATFWIRGKGTWGGDDSDFDKEKVGGIFKTNQDASSEEPIFVDKWHWQQFLFDKELELRFGRQEPVKDLFDRSVVMGHEDDYFLNEALVRNGTIPSKKGLALFAKWRFAEEFYVSGAVFDAQSEDRQTNFNTAFHDEAWFRVFGELGYEPEFERPGGALKGLYRVGAWYDPIEKERYRDTLGGRLAPRYKQGDWGGYVGFDQQVWRENEDDGQGVTVAARFGFADGEVNELEYFWAMAMKWEGIVPDRDKDYMGIGVGQGILSDELRRIDVDADRETVYEMYYSFYVNPWLTISPDLQYITNTGGGKDDPDTAVAGIRVKMRI